MSIPMWLMFAVAWLSSLAPITQGRGNKIDEKQLNKYVTKRRLPLTRSVRSVALTEIGRRERVTLTCGAIGIGLWAVIAAVLKLRGVDHDLGPFAFVAAPLAASLGGYFATMRAPERLIADAPRVARAVEVTSENYEPKGQITAFRLVPLTIFVGLIASWIIYALMPEKADGYLQSMILVSVGVLAMFGGWVLLALARRNVVERPQHAHNDVELIWDDALRADALYGLTGNGISFGMLAPLISLVVAVLPLLETTRRVAHLDLATGLGIAGVVVGMVCWLVLLVPSMATLNNKTQFHSLWRGHRFTEDAAC